MAGTEDTIDKCVKHVVDISGKCRLHKHAHASCAVRYAKDSDDNVSNGQGECVKQLRPIQHHELTGADAEAKASKMIADMPVSLRGAWAYALITQMWLIVRVTSLQRFQEPTNLHV
eukprot:2004163-Pyramimonas_sp.AAC.1